MGYECQWGQSRGWKTVALWLQLTCNSEWLSQVLSSSICSSEALCGIRFWFSRLWLKSMCFVLYCFEPLSRGKSWPVPLKWFSSSGPWYKKLVISARHPKIMVMNKRHVCCYRCVGGPEWNLLLFGSPHIHCIRLSQTGDLFAATRHSHFPSSHHWPFLVNSSSSSSSLSWNLFILTKE